MSRLKYSETAPTCKRWSLEESGFISPDFSGRSKPGWVYFIVCKETERCKIGFTAGEPEKRLKALQTGAAGHLRLLAAQPGTVETERALHEKFAAHHVHGEWFDVCDEIFAYLCATVWIVSNIWADAGLPLEPWMRAGLRMLNDGMADVPEDLMALTRGEEPA